MNFRQSFDIMNAQNFRNTVAFDYSPPEVFRQSLANNNSAFRNSLDMERARDLIDKIAVDPKPQHSSYNKLKNTLSELQLKVNKAKKELRFQGNILEDININENSDVESIGDMIESKMNKQSKAGNNGILAVTSPKVELGIFKCESNKTFPSMSATMPYVIKSKEYYLEEIAKALGEQGGGKEALEHLGISLKVLRSIGNFEPCSFMEIEDRKVSLPRKPGDKRKTLVVDIDETIIHCEEDESFPHDLELSIQLQNGEYATAYIAIRPYAISFLKKMSKQFEIIAFTASHESYADVVLDEIDPGREFIEHRLYRAHCHEIHANIYSKDLRIIDRELSQMVLVDNAPYSYLFQLENGIPITPFYQGHDLQLPRLEKYLQKLALAPDVRELNKRVFQLHRYKDFTSAEALAKELYFSGKSSP